MRKRTAAWLALLPALGVAELALDAAFARRAPRFEDWSALEAPVRELRRAGDLVVVAPSWGEPLARRALGDAAFPLRDLGRSWVDGYAGAVEISALGSRSPELSAFREVDARRVGPFVVRRLENPAPARVLVDLTDALAPERVEVAHLREGASGSPCPWNPRAPLATGGLGGHPTFGRRRFECPGGAFFHVGETVVADEEFRPRRCVFAHPPDRADLSLRYRDVPLDGRLVGRAGLYWMIERERRGAPITLEARVDGRVAGSFTHLDGQGFAPFEIALGGEAGARGVLELRVRTDDFQHRHFCFHAEVR